MSLSKASLKRSIISTPGQKKDLEIILIRGLPVF
nr:MAG TPA: hypothetical protein [Caudoviricetes sp.]